MVTPSTAHQQSISLLQAMTALISKAMALKSVTLPASNFYALEVSRALGLGDAGALRAGLAPYSTRDDVDRLIAGLKELLA